MKKTAIILMALIISSFLSTSCQGSETKKWIPPKFVKEWEIKEIKPGLPHHIISMTANKNGIFVLVKVEGMKYLPVEKPKKKTSQMTKEEKKRFLDTYTKWTSDDIGKLTDDEKNEAIDFIINNLMPPKNANEMIQEEKAKILDFFILYHDKKLRKEYQGWNLEKTVEKYGKDSVLNDIVSHIRTAVGVKVLAFRIQHYDLEGNFIKQWPEGNKLSLSDNLRKRTNPIIVSLYDQIKRESYKVDSREQLINPLVINSDGFNNIYLADYEGNKIVKFNSEGSVLNLWRIEQVKELGRHEDLSIHKGVSIVLDKVYLISKGWAENVGYVPRVSICNLNGEKLLVKNLSILKVPAFNPYEYPAARIPFKTIEGYVNDMAVDSNGNIYLLAGMVKIFKYNKDFRELKSFEPVLKEGFNTDVKVYNPETGTYEKYASWWGRGFNSQKGSGFGLGLRYYDLSKLYVSPENELFVTFIGQKPFGVINAIIYNTDGKILGYWKEEEKGRSEWYKDLNDIEKIKSKELNLNLAFYEKNIFAGKTIQYRKGDNLRSDTGSEIYRSLIQRFDK